MRHAVMGFFILIMLIFAGASIYTAETKTMHQNELDSILGAAMEESMEILTVNPTYSIGKEVEGKELAADFIQNMLMRTTSKSTFEVEILTADAPEGILLPKEILPVENGSGDEKVKGWRAVGQLENTIYTKENIGTVQAKGDMDFEAVYEKTGSKAD